jgi:hypothetical protein
MYMYAPAALAAHFAAAATAQVSEHALLRQQQGGAAADQAHEPQQ